MQDKQTLRQQALQARAGIAPEIRAAASAQICLAARNLPVFRQANVLLPYAPIGSEADIRPLVQAAWAAGKQAAFPRCVPGTREMEFFWVQSLNELSPGAFGVPEPQTNAHVPESVFQSTNGPALLIVPGAAFDRRGFRLGYGKGYYDRFLARYRGHSLGVCFDVNLYDKLPIGEYDLPVQAVLTEQGLTVVS